MATSTVSVVDVVVEVVVVAAAIVGVGVVAVGVGVDAGAGGLETARLVGLGVLGRLWHSVQPRRNRVTASRGRNAYVSVI